MKILEKIKNFFNFKKLNYNPQSYRFNFIDNPKDIVISNINEYKVWYLGDSSELLNFYTNRIAYGLVDNPIYNRNEANYFWSISASEKNIKRSHSGLPNAMIKTLVAIVGVPKISCDDSEELNETLNKILDFNNFYSNFGDEQLALSLVEGWGAYKISANRDISEYPILEFYEALDCDFNFKNSQLESIVFKDYYFDKKSKRNYVLKEIRRTDFKSSYIQYKLYRLDKEYLEEQEEDLDNVDYFKDVKSSEIVLNGFNGVLGVPIRIFFDANNKNYGRSIFASKIDQFDNLDQAWSQLAQTVKVSTPVEYYSVDVLDRDRITGKPLLPNVYNRQFIAKPSDYPDGDGKIQSKDITTTQPTIQAEQYSQVINDLVSNILTGILSPSSLGIDVKKKDNADAQREKEKTTINTRNKIIDAETNVIKKVCNLLLMLYEYNTRGVITKKDYSISVKFNDFANPSFETKLPLLSQAWENGAMSTEKYVDLLWEDKLSDEDKEKEIEWLDNNKEKDNLDLREFEPNEDEERFRKDSEKQGKTN